jgi:hypothetical protein
MNYSLRRAYYITGPPDIIGLLVPANRLTKRQNNWTGDLLYHTSLYLYLNVAVQYHLKVNKFITYTIFIKIYYVIIF